MSENKERKVRKMAVLTAKCNRSFVVSSEKSSEFISHSKNNNINDNNKAKEKNSEMLLKMSSKVKSNEK